MRLLLSSILLLFLLTVPSRAETPKPKREIHIPRAEDLLPGTSSSTATPNANKKSGTGMTKLGYVRAVVKGGITDGELTLQVKLSYLEPNPQAQAKYVREYRQLLSRQQAILNSRNPVQAQQQLYQLARMVQQMRRDRQNLFRVKEKQTEVKALVTDDLKVRVTQLPEEFDDKGNIKEYTPEELKKLKGKEGLPGYPAKRDSIQNGQNVQVLLAHKKGKDGAKGAENKTYALVVVILPKK
jgi:hypothetical protein